MIQIQPSPEQTNRHEAFFFGLCCSQQSWKKLRFICWQKKKEELKTRNKNQSFSFTFLQPSLKVFCSSFCWNFTNIVYLEKNKKVCTRGVTLTCKVSFSMAIRAKATKLGGCLGKFLKFFRKKTFWPIGRNFGLQWPPNFGHFFRNLG